MIGQDELRQVVKEHLDTGIPDQTPECSCGWSGDIANPQSEHLSDVLVAAVSDSIPDEHERSA